MASEQTNTKRTIKDILKVSFGNVVKLLGSILVGFLLPKIIGVTDYGYYKIFTLYATYIGLFHFGFADGIYLVYGGMSYDELKRSSFRTYSVFLIVMELLISVAFGIASLCILSGELRFIFICLSVLLLSANITNYYQIISQITSRFNELSTRTIIQSALTVIAILVLWIIYKVNGELLTYRVYTVVFVAINVILAVWYMFTYREITFGARERLSSETKALKVFFLLGFPLLFANLCSTFILAIDRQFVSVLFDTNIYAIYAFAYNMLALITTALAAVSTVLYPTLKKANSETLKANYSRLVEAVLIITFACLFIYFPLKWFVPWFLPKYSDSLPIFRVILPGLAVSSVITIVMHNYYKAEGKEVMFFVKSIAVLLLSGVANYVSYLFFKTTISISIASILIMVVWYVLIEEYFIRVYKIRWLKNFTYMMTMSIGFYLITAFDNWWITMLVYTCLFLAVTFLFYWNDVKKISNKLYRGNKLLGVGK